VVNSADSDRGRGWWLLVNRKNMKKLLALALFAGALAGCCGLFECKKNTDGAAATSCCGCTHDHASKEHHGEEDGATDVAPLLAAENEAGLGDGTLKSEVPVEGAEALAEAAHNAEIAAVIA